MKKSKKHEKSRVKKNRNNSRNFIIIGIVVGIIIIISIAIFLQKDSSPDTKTDDIIQPPQCLSINLKISEINPNTNMLKISRGIGKGDLSKIKILVNGNPIDNLLASDIKEGATKIFIININPGDNVEIAPILKDGTICAISDTKIA